MSYWSRAGWVAGLLLVALLSAGVAGAATWRLLGAGFKREAPVNVAVEVPEAVLPQAPKPVTMGRVTILLLGVDERSADGGRSDTMMVASMNPAKGELALLSLPRDLYAQIPGHGYDKINHAYAYGHQALALATVQQLLDIQIDHFAIVNFHGFKAVVDAVGGVEIDVEQRMDYDDPYDEDGGLHIHFEPGLQLMDGQKALEYARFRSDATGDVGRMRRQQQIIRAVMQKALTPANVGRIPALIASLSEVVRTDLSLGQMLQLADLGKNLAASGPLQAGIAGGEGIMLHQVYYTVPDLPDLRADAYRLLLGSEPPADFLGRAEQARQAMLAVLARERAEEQEAAAAAAQLLAPTQPPAAAQPGAPAQAGAGAAPAGAATGGAGGGQKLPGAAVRPTVALLDFSGANLLTPVSNRLKQAGFRVVRIARTSRIGTVTVVIDRSGNPAVAARLRQLFPYAEFSQGAPSGDAQVEIRLGRDAR